MRLDIQGADVDIVGPGSEAVLQFEPVAVKVDDMALLTVLGIPNDVPNISAPEQAVGPAILIPGFGARSAGHIARTH